MAIQGSGFLRTAPRGGDNRNRDRHSFKIHLLPCEPIDVSVGDSAEVFVDVDTSGIFGSDEQYPAVVSSTDHDGAATDIAIKVFVGKDLIDNDPAVAIYSVAGLAIVDSNGNEIDHLQLDTFTPGNEGLAAGEGLVPIEFALDQNYPNPFNAATAISFSLRETGHVRLVIYDILGRKVRHLIDDRLPAGYHTVNWNGKDDHGKPVASGLYFYRLAAGEFAETKKMVLMK